MLEEIYSTLGGSNWLYSHGTDVYNGGGRWMSGDPCADRWFGVQCDTNGTSAGSGTHAHVVGLFPNPRGSGNPLIGQLPSSIANLTMLQHFYSSNDKTPSSLSGTLPASFGTLRHLKCMYFSHNELTGTIPETFTQLTNLQAFLMRRNHLHGELIDFSPLRSLVNVWFDGQNLTGSLSSLGTLPNLTFLQASDNQLSGTVPSRLCGIQCEAEGNKGLTCPSTAAACCELTHCGGAKAPTPAPPTTTMGECYPQ